MSVYGLADVEEYEYETTGVPASARYAAPKIALGKAASRGVVPYTPQQPLVLQAPTPPQPSNTALILDTVNRGLDLTQAIVTRKQQPQYVDASGRPIGPQIGAGVGGLADGIAQQFGISTTTLTLIAIGGAVLLFMRPPNRKS